MGEQSLHIEYRLEVLPELETYILSGRSLQDWHNFLTTDHYTGEPNGHVEVPCGRYGSTTDQTAWWAIAAHAAYTYATGDENEAQQSIDYFMSLAVNGDMSVYGLVDEFKWVIPDELQGMLDFDRVIAGHI